MNDMGDTVTPNTTATTTDNRSHEAQVYRKRALSSVIESSDCVAQSNKRVNSQLDNGPDHTQSMSAYVDAGSDDKVDMSQTEINIGADSFDSGAR